MKVSSETERDSSSFVSFVDDMWIRSLAYRDWAYKFGESNFPHGWSQTQLKQLNALYCSILNQFVSRVVLKGPLGQHPIERVEFHRKFGWVLYSANSKAYLGKASILDDLPLQIGTHTYISGHATLRGLAPLKIGAFTSIAEGLYCNTSPDLHPTQYASMINFSSESRCIEDGLGMDIRYQQLDLQESGIDIGSDVWLGRNVRIFHGARIADGCVIAERSLVRGVTEPYGVYAGTPARLKKFRFKEKTIAFLLETQWWDWPNDRILRNRGFFETNLYQFDGDPTVLVVP